MSIRASLSQKNLRMPFLLLATTAILAACGSSSQASGSGAGSNARSGPASGGVSGTVGSVSTSSFTVSTSAGVKGIPRSDRDLPERV